MTIKPILTAAIVAVSALSTTLAQPVSAQTYVEIVEGIGFGTDRAQAYRASIRAWVKQAKRDYPNSRADFSRAIRSQIDCSFDGPSSGGGGYSTQGIGVEGPVEGNWSCSVQGIPNDIF